jgi:type IV secretion system protein VirD4
VALTREGAGVMSTVQRHLSFLDSELVAAAVATSTFDVAGLLERPTTLFLQIPPDHLDAQRGLLRCWLSTVIRGINREGNERSAEVLCLLDEASALGGLAAVEEALVRGRSAGVRLLLAYQSDSQVKAAFKDKPTLIQDNCSVQLYLAADSIESAERLSKSLGEWTQVVESASENESKNRQAGGADMSAGTQVNWTWNWGRSWQPQARALLKPEEILTLSRDFLIALIAGMPPILARRVKWYADPLFVIAAAPGRNPPPLWWALLAAALALLGWTVFGGR